MRGGRNKVSEHLKLIRGTARPDRAGAETPRPRPIAPTMPRGLDPTARRLWRRLAPQLEKLGLLAAIDGSAFAALARAWARLEDAERRLRQILAEATGTLTDDHLRRIRRAEVSVEHAEHSFRLLAGEFGLTPSSRSRLNVSSVRDEDAEIAEFNRRYLQKE